jgi:hypothetical protein
MDLKGQENETIYAIPHYIYEDNKEILKFMRLYWMRRVCAKSNYTDTLTQIQL